MFSAFPLSQSLNDGSVAIKQNPLTTHTREVSSDGKTLSNIKGTNRNIIGINSLIVGDGNKVISANPTGLGAGNFYYEIICKFTFVASSYIFGDGDTATNNRWFALQHQSSTGGLNLVIDGDGTKSTHEVFNSSQVQDNDIIKVVVKREGSTVTSIGTNLTQNGTATNVYSNSNDFSGGNTLTIGGISDGSGIFGFTNVEMFLFKAGTSETDLVTHYVFAEGSGESVFDISGQGNHALKNASYSFPARGTEDIVIGSHNHQYGFITSAITEKSVFSGTNCTGAINADGDLVVTSTADSNVSWTLGFPVQLTGSVTLAYDAVVSDGGSVACNINLNDTGSFWATSGGSPSGNIPNGSYSGTATISSDQDIGLRFNVYGHLTTGQTVTFSNLTLTPASGTCRFPALINKTKQQLTLDGANDYIETGVVLNTGTDDYTITGTFILNPASSNKGILDGKDSNDDGIRILFDNGGNRMMCSHNTVDCNVSGTWDDGAVHTFSMVKSGDTLTATIDSTVATADVSGQTIAVTAEAEVGRHAGGDYFDGSLREFKFVQGTTTLIDYDFQSNAGTTTIVNSAGTNGTLTNATLTNAWAKRYVDSNGSIVPANYIQGHTTITNPSGYVHNNSESSVVLASGTKTFAQLNAVNNLTATQLFVRKGNGFITEIIESTSAVSGGTKEVISSYAEH